MADLQSVPRPTHPASHADDRKQRLAGFVFRIYKLVLSPALHAIAPSRCLYLPTCSEYAYTAISRFGVVRGTWMAIGRLARCHPWGKGGFDPVPGQSSCAQSLSAERDCSGSRHDRTDHLP